MKNFWSNKDKRKGVIGTLLFHLALLIVFLFAGLTYFEPKPEDGIVINFGTSATGQGNQQNGTVTPPPQQTEATQKSPQQNTSNQNQEPVQTQDVVDAPAMESQGGNPDKSEKDTEEKTEKQQSEKETPEKQKPSDELNDLLKNVEKSEEGGEGVTKGSGDQGNPEGDRNSQNRTGGATGGGGGGGQSNYLLGNRQALQKPKPEYQCEGEGRVVVKIYVDRNGKVTRAVPGEKIPDGPASTTASSCLYKKAKAAALRTTWQEDPEASPIQAGYIIYNFQKQ